MTDFPETLVFDISEADRENILATYEGDEPPNNTRLKGVLKGMFLTKDKDGAYLVKVLYQAEGGDYDGYPGWDNVSLKSSAAFKWAPLCDDVLKVTVEDLKARTVIDRERGETGAGWRITSVGDNLIDGTQEVMFTVAYRHQTDENGRVVRDIEGNPVKQAIVRDPESI